MSSPSHYDWRNIMRRFGPQMGRRPTIDIVRCSVGAGIAILICAVLLRELPNARASGLFLVSGFAAMSVLLFVLPNSPLAQPWSAVVGMVIATGVAITVLKLVPPPYADGLAVTLAIAAMMAARALHPPAAGMALYCALEFEAGRPLGYDFVLFPVAVLTALLIVVAIVWNRAFGLTYPVRPPRITPSHPASTGRNAPQKHQRNLDEAELAALLVEFGQSANVSASELAQLIDVGRERVTRSVFMGTTVADIMTAHPATVVPEAPLSEIVHKMTVLGVKSLPVVDSEGAFLGLIDGRRAMAKLVEEIAGLRRTRFGLRTTPPEPEARTLMTDEVAPTTPDAPTADLLNRLSDQHAHAIPVLVNGRLVGIVSRTDLMAMILSQHTLPPSS